MSAPNNRIRYMDGLRGLAILLVVLYHCFAISSRVPYGGEFAEFPLFKYGRLGVELFFMISGFVILMTLEKCSGPWEFFRRRWLRLFPAMLIVTLIIFVVAPFLPGHGVPQLVDLLPGILFIEPGWISALIGSPVWAIETPLWTLFLEVRFYVFFGGLYFLLGKRWAIRGVAIVFFLAVGLSLLAQFSGDPRILAVKNFSNTNFGFQLFGWFLIGTIAYEIWKGWDWIKVLLSVVVALPSLGIIGFRSDPGIIIFGACLFILFLCSIRFPIVQRVVANPVFLFLGFISYPLYLIHESPMLWGIHALSQAWPFLPSILLPVVPFLVVTVVAFLVAWQGEPRLKRFFIWLFSLGKGSKTAVKPSQNEAGRGDSKPDGDTRG